MADGVIDLTVSDEDVTEISKPAEASGSGKTRRGSRRKRNKGQSAQGNEASSNVATETAQRSNRSSSPSKSGAKSQPEQVKSNSLLARLGMMPNENKEDIKTKRSSRAGRRTRKERIAGNELMMHARGFEKWYVNVLSQTDGGGGGGAHRRWSRSPSPNRPEEIPLSELPVEQLFYVDNGPPGRALGEQEQPLPPGTGIGSASPITPGIGAIPNTKAIKKPPTKERKGEHKGSEEDKVSGDITGSEPDEVKFIGGSALKAEDQVIISAAAAAGQISTSVTESTQAEVVKPTTNGGTKSNGLSLPEHVTLWAEGDDGPPLEDITAALEPDEDIEYLDYEGDQATGVPRYFVPDSTTSSKKACRTCGEEGHIARNCKKLIRCPEQFKTYVYLSEEERLQVLKQREGLKKLGFGEGGEGYIAPHIWCYNCGNGGHWGDDCKDSKPSSIPTEPCAFGSFNASRGPFGDLDNVHGRDRDLPRPAWLDDDPHLQDVGRRGKEASMRRSRVAEASRIARDRDDDDWFSRAAGPSRDQRQASDRAKDNLPAKPKFTFQSRDSGGGSSRSISGGHDSTRDRDRDRRREKDRDKGYDNERRKRGRDYEDEKQNRRRREYDDNSRARRDYEDWRDEEKRSRRCSATEEPSSSPPSPPPPPLPFVMDAEKANVSEKFSGVSVNVESYDGDEGQHSDHTKRVLNARQVQLFSIGGTIGTSIFVAIGTALVRGGPLSLLIGYAFWCSVIFCVNEGQAEMVCLLPIESSFNRFATRWVDRAFGAATSWNYWICMVALFNFEITAFTAVVGFWTDDVHPAIFPVAMLAVYAALNLWSAKFFGETEFWISLMKVILIIGLLIMTFFLMVGVNPQRDAFGFRFWRDPGPMAEYISTGDMGRFQGFFACVLSAGFAVAGPDMLSIIAGEAKAPRRIMPKAFRTVFVRLILFFVLGSLAVGILVPYNDPVLNAAISEGKPGAARSPYVAALTRLNVPVLPHIINAMILTSIFSAGNAFLFNGSRTLHGIALDGHYHFARWMPLVLASEPELLQSTGLVHQCLNFRSVGNLDCYVHNLD
ncbi:General amino acid permease AGP2 [Rhizoctonia solani AG-1 IB]|uniref:General amino acid permease AGP2 n=1 Tax=Thanatephorus cucumeris (strain AG1-IB / isolate 7/3/14) TaxID=1108050 RepID=M5BPC8_THACB|nr:General amino acid permease AGP2 [Rhizoctonia solani AG-1 IB]